MIVQIYRAGGKRAAHAFLAGLGEDDCDAWAKLRKLLELVWETPEERRCVCLLVSTPDERRADMEMAVAVKVPVYQKKVAVNMAELQMGIAAQLFKRRQELGLTEQQVADLMGSTLARVSEFERGESNATYEYVAKYAAAVDMVANVQFRELKKLPTDAGDPEQKR